MTSASSDHSSTTYADANLLLDNLRSTNQLIHRQATIIILFCAAVLGLMQLSTTQWERNQELYSKIELLTAMLYADDLESFIKNDSHRINLSLMHDIDIDALYYRLQNGNYADRAPIVEALSALKEERRKTWGISNNTVNVLGIEVPIAAWFYLIPPIITVLFHNLTEATLYRRQLIEKAGSDIDDWRQGPYLLSLRAGANPDTSETYLRYVSSVIVFAFLMLPGLTAFLFIMSSYNLLPDYQNASNDIILAINWACLCLILINIAILIYRENKLGIRTLINSLASPDVPAERRPKGTFRKRLAPYSVPILIGAFNLVTEIVHNERSAYIPYHLAATLMPCLLPVGLHLLAVRRASVLARVLVVAGAILSLFWLSVPTLVWLGYLRYTHASPDEIVQLALAIAAGASLVGLVYVKAIAVEPEGKGA